MILAIVGSTNITIPQRKTAWRLIRGLILTYEDAEVISGGAYGIDQIAEGVALDLGKWKCKYLPIFKRWKRQGYEDRNMIIAHECDVLWAFRSEQSETYGSGWTADRAEELGKEVHRVKLP